MTTPPTGREKPPWRLALARSLLRLAAVVAAALVVQAATGWLLGRIAALPPDLQGPAGALLIGALLVAYAALLAIPFVPGVEIGVAILMAHGAQAAPLVYIATVAGLATAFGLGRWLPASALAAVLRDLHMMRACRLVDELAPLDEARRLALLRGRLPARLAPALIGGRYVALAVLLNLPGNAVIGGGGGIMLLAGMCRLFTLPGAIATVALAVAPVPLAVAIAGGRIFS